MKIQVETYATTCDRCAAKLSQCRQNAPLHQRSKEAKPFALVEVDLKGPIPITKERYDKIVVITDPSTKYAEMHPIRGQIAEAVCKTMRDWVSRYGLPEIIDSDNGPWFVSHTFAQFCTDHGIEHTYSPPYRSQGNAEVERLNRTMWEALSNLVDKHPRKWSEHLPDVQLAYNTATHASTGVVPYELVFKECPRPKFERVAERISPETVLKKAEELQSKANKLFQRAQQNHAKLPKNAGNGITAKVYLNHRPKARRYVWKRNLRARTFADRWMGQYTVIRPTTDVH